MTAPQPPPQPQPPTLVSQHPSTSGLQIALHPLALLTISDHITRHTLRQQAGTIVGALLGSQDGRNIAIEYAYEAVVLPAEDGRIVIDKAWFETKLRLFKETHPTADLIGWFTTTSHPQFAPAPAHVAVHQELLAWNESLIVLLLNPSPAAALSGGGKLPLTIYESIYEADDKDSSKQLGLKFVPLPYTIESGEAEMIGMDFVAKGAGNAGEEKKDTPAPTAAPTTATTSSGKGKEPAAAVVVAEKGPQQQQQQQQQETVDIGAANDELLSNLTAKKNAIVMLNARIKLLLRYLQNPPDGVTNHQILREIKSLTHARLPLLRPANVKAYEQEKMAEESDVNLVVLLGAVTRCIEDVRNVGRKSAGIDAVLKHSKKGNMFDEGLDFSGMVGTGGAGGGGGDGGGGGGVSGGRRTRGMGLFGNAWQ